MTDHLMQRAARVIKMSDDGEATEVVAALRARVEAAEAEVERLRILAVEGHIEDDDNSGYCLCGAEWICPEWTERLSKDWQIEHLTAEHDAARAENARLRAAAGPVLEHYDALSGPRAHHLGCLCSGTNDGVHTCRGLHDAMADLRRAVEEES